MRECHLNIYTIFHSHLLLLLLLLRRRFYTTSSFYSNHVKRYDNKIGNMERTTFTVGVGFGCDLIWVFTVFFRTELVYHLRNSTPKNIQRIHRQTENEKKTKIYIEFHRLSIGKFSIWKKWSEKGNNLCILWCDARYIV